MSHAAGRRLLSAAFVCIVIGALASSASAATATRVFHPRVGHALGLIPPVNRNGEFNTQPTEGGVFAPLVYHGGSVMNEGVTVHTIFWAPPGFPFPGKPKGALSYEELIEQFYTDVATASETEEGSECEPGTTNPCNIFSTLTQYADGTEIGKIKPGKYEIKYEKTNPNDAIVDKEPYPEGECVSPQNARACFSDEALEEQVNKVAEEHGNERGLKNLWFVFLPPNVDECIEKDVCGTNAFGGYHSWSSVDKSEVTIYALAIDPVIEVGAIAQGADPNGNPEAETAIDIAAHETNEAMTDPEGVGWMDPNGYEVADKCEFGPQHGSPIGFADDGSPYNQLINGDEYLTQEIWSNDDEGCVQGTEETENPLPLPQVNLTQYSGKISGNIGREAVDTVKVKLLRGLEEEEVEVASGETKTDSEGNWELTLPRAVGDDRDEIVVEYSGPQAPLPHTQLIRPGNGGNPFTESGWTGWTDLNEGTAVEAHGLEFAPCFQIGVLSYEVGGVPGARSPTEFCGVATDTAFVELVSPITTASAVTVSSNDNRAFVPESETGSEEANAEGSLVKLTVAAGEPGAAWPFPNDVPAFESGGHPLCVADLGVQEAACFGLVPNDTYTIKDGAQTVSAKADEEGIAYHALSIKGGDAIELSNSASRVLTTLHVANLKVNLEGNGEGVVKSGTCTPDEYWGGPLIGEPISAFAGAPSSPTGGGAALTGEVCPESGDAAGLPTFEIGQTDERSGGETFTEVADVANASPLEGETMYGSFTALAEASDGVSPIALSIAPASGGAPVFTATNVDTTTGVPVSGLAPGIYKATWTVSDANGDTRAVTSRFIEQSGVQGPEGKEGKEGKEGPSGGPPGPEGKEGKQGPAGKEGKEGLPGLEGPAGKEGKQGPAGPKPSVSCKLTGKKHNKITCKVAFPTTSTVKGTLHLSISRGAHIAALGHGQLSHGSVTVTMRELRRLGNGAWTVTLVISATHQHAQTITRTMRLH